MSSAQNNKRIAKNTLMLYIRMIFVMGVTLYTSRVVLNTIGVEDYGVYNVVGGIVSIFTFINGGMVSATQRYITYELGRNNHDKLSKVFSASLQIHAIIALIIVILGETIGLWFLYEKMVIPADRFDAAMWVYQCSIIASVVNIMSIPYNADIIAHEKMSAFAYISVIEVSLKLSIVFILQITPVDKLKLYACLILCVQLLIRYIYSRYCSKHFLESHYHHIIDKPLFKEMISFAGWSFWGNLASVLFTQGLNMMLNVFFGPIINAARGVAVQVQTAVQQFVTNFQTALNPQITKNYASGDLKAMHILMFRSARFSFFLLLMITLPILLETKYILTLWLKTVPENTVFFTRIIICISLLYTIANPCVIANQATGKIKRYQAIVGSLLLTILPISYVVLKLGAPAYSVFIVHLCVEVVVQIARMCLLRKLIDLPVMEYFKHIYTPIVLVILVSILLPIGLGHHIEEGFVRLVMITCGSLISVASTSYLLGLTREERAFINKRVLAIVKR